MISAAQKVNCGRFGDLIVGIADQLGFTMNHRFERAHEIYIDELKVRINGSVVDILGVSRLMAFSTAQRWQFAIEQPHTPHLLSPLFMNSRTRLLR